MSAGARRGRDTIVPMRRRPGPRCAALLALAIAAPAQAVEFSIDATAAATESTGQIDFTVRADAAPGEQVTITYQTTDGTANSRTDYTGVAPGSLTFPAAATMHTLRVPITPDSLNEDNETFTVRITFVSGSHTINSAMNTATGTITDDDPLPILQIDSPSAPESRTLGFTVRMVDNMGMPVASGRNVSFTFQTLTTGTATGGASSDSSRDFTAVSGLSRTIFAGDSSLAVTLGVNNDTTAESDETVHVQLSAAMHAAFDTDGTATTLDATGTILDDDGPRFSVANATAAEDAGSMMFTVTLSSAISAMSSVMLTPSSETGDTATAGTDYTATPIKVDFAAMATTAMAAVPLMDDDDREQSETFTVTLSAPTGTGVQGLLPGQSTARGTITDDDLPVVSWRRNVERITEGEDAVFTISITEAPTTNLVVAVWVHEEETTEFNYLPGGAIFRTTVTIRAGQTEATLVVPTVDDNADDARDVVRVLLRSGAGYRVDPMQGTVAGIRVFDNDIPRISLSTDHAVVREGGQITFVLSSDIPLGAQTTFTVDYTVTGGVTSGPLSSVMREIDTGQTMVSDAVPPLTVGTRTNGTAGTGGTVTATIRDPGEAAFWALGETHSVTVQVVDTESVQLSIAADQTAVDEGDDATFTITAWTESPTPLTVRARVATELQRIAGGGTRHTVMLPANTSTVTLTVPTPDDRSYGPGETLTVTLRPRMGYTVAQAPFLRSAQVRVLEDDTDVLEELELGLPEVSIAVQGDHANILEGAQDELVFTVALPGPAAQDMEINVELAGVGDFAADLPRTETVTIARGATAAEVAVALVADDAHEADGKITATVLPGDDVTRTVAYTTVRANYRVLLEIQDADGMVLHAADSVIPAGTVIPADARIVGYSAGATVFESHGGAAPDYTSIDTVIPAERMVTAPLYRPAQPGFRGPARHTAEVLVRDDDRPVVRIVAVEDIVQEGGLVSFRAIADAAPYKEIEVLFDLEDPDGFLLDGTVLEAHDSGIASGATGGRRGTFTTDPKSGVGNGVVRAVLRPGDDYVIAPGGRVAAVVISDDAAPMATIRPAADAHGGVQAFVHEGGTARFEVALERDANVATNTSSVTVQVALTGTGAATGVTSPVTVTFPGSSTAMGRRALVLEVPIPQDADVEPHGALTAEIQEGAGYAPAPDLPGSVALPAQGGALSMVELQTGALLAGARTARIAVRDDDIPEFNIEADAEAVTEGGMATFTITASSAPLADMTLNIAVLDASGHLMGTAPTTHRFAGDGSLTLSTLRLQTQAAANVQSGMITARLLPGPGYTLDAGSKIYTDASGAAASPRVTCYLDEAGMPTAPSYETATACTNSGFDFGSQGNRPSVEYTGSAFSRDNLVRIAQQVAVVDHRDPRNRRVQSPGGAPEDFTPAATTTAHEYVHVREARIRVDDDSNVPTVRIAPAVDVTHEGMPVAFVVTASAAAPAGGLAVMVMVAESDPAGEKTGSFLDSGETGMQTVTIDEGETEARLALSSTNDDTAQSGAMAKSLVTATLQTGGDYAVAVEPGNAARMELVDAGAARPGPALPVMTIAADAASIVEGQDAVFTVVSSQPMWDHTAVAITVTDAGGFVDRSQHLDKDGNGMLPRYARVPRGIDRSGMTLYDSASGGGWVKTSLDGGATMAAMPAAVPESERSGTLTIPTMALAGAGTGTIMVQLTASPNPGTVYDYEVGAVAMAQVTVTDANEITATAAPVAEAANAMATVTVSLDEAAPAGGVTLMYRTVDGTATSGATDPDFTAVSTPMTLTIPATMSSGTINIAIDNDTILEANETFTVRLSDATGGAAFAGGDTLDIEVTITDDETLTVVFSPVHTEVNEGGTASFRPAFAGLASLETTVTIDYAITGTAMAGDDYTAPTRTLAVADLVVTNYQVDIPVATDSISPENDETLVFDVTAMRLPGDTAHNSRFTLPMDSDPITIKNVAPPSTPLISVRPTTGMETVAEAEDAMAQFTVSSTSAAPAGGITVTLMIAQTGMYTTSTSETATIAEGSLTGTFNVAIVNDNVDEANGSITATVQDGSDHDVGVPAAATVTVTDDDVPVLSIAVSPDMVTEGGSATFTVTANPAPYRTLTVALMQSGNSPHFEGTSAALPLTLMASETSAAFTVSTMAVDTTAGSTVTYMLGAPADASLYTVAASPGDRATLTILDDAQSLPSVLLTAPPTATEGTDANATFTLTATPAPTASISVTVRLGESGDMIAAADEIVHTVSISSTGTTMLSIPIADDNANEAASTVTATIVTDDTVYAAGGTGTASILVADDDIPELSLAVNPTTVAEGASATYTITADIAPYRQLTVPVTRSGENNDRHFLSIAPAVPTIAADATTGTFTVATMPAAGTDGSTIIYTLAAPMPNAGYTVAASPAGAAALTVADSTTTLTTVTVAATQAAATEGPGAQAMFVFTANPAPGAGERLRVNMTVSETGDAVADNDKSDFDFDIEERHNGSFTWNVPIVNDGVNEAASAITVALRSGAYLQGGAGMATVLVADDDIPELSIAVSPASVPEGADTATFTVTASIAPYRTLRPALTRTGADTHFAAIMPAAPELEAGRTSATFTVDTTATPAAGDSTITYTLGTGAGYTVASANSSAALTVTNVAATPPTVTIRAAAATATEGPGVRASYTLTATPAPTATLSVTVNVSETGDMIASTSEGARTVMISTSGAGALNLPVVDDDASESASVITAMIASDASYVVGSPAAATVTVADDDTPTLPVVTIAAVSASVTEGPGVAVAYTLTAAPAPTAPLAVSVTVSETGDMIASANEGARTVSIPTTGTMTLRIPVVDDTATEPASMITARIAAGSGYTAGTPASAVVTAADDDLPAMSIATAQRSVAEGTELVFTVTSSLAAAGPLAVSVRVSESGGSAIAGASPRTETVTIAPGGRTGTLRLATDDDMAVEGDVAVTAALQTGAGYTLGAPASARVTVTSEDLPVVSIADATAVEGQELEFAVALSARAVQPVTVMYTVAGAMMGAGTVAAAAGAHYTAPATTSVTIPAGSAAATISIPTLRDPDTMQDRTLTVTLSSPAGATLAAAATTATGRITRGLTPEAVAEVFEETLSQVAATVSGAAAGVLQGRIAAVFEGRMLGGGLPGAADAGLAPAGETIASAVLKKALSMQAARERGQRTSLDFALPLSAAGAGASDITVWGRGFYQELDSDERQVAFDGDITGGALGIDVLRGDVLFGLSVSDSEADMNFTDGGTGQTGRQQTSLTGVHPYVGWRASRDVQFWGTLGVSRGDAELHEDAAARVTERDVEMTSLSAGGSGTLYAGGSLHAGGATRVALVADGTFARIEDDNDSGSPDVESGWVRAGAELSHTRSVSTGTTLNTKLGLVLRHDFGDTVSGGGVEAEGGLDLNMPHMGLQLDLKARVLLAHEEDLEDWGVSGGAVWRPGGGGRGLSVTFRPRFGDTASTRERLWARGLAELDVQAAASSRHGLELGYGLPVHGGAETLHLFARSAALGGGNLGLGADLEIGRSFAVGYEATLRQGGAEGDAEHRAYIRFQRRF